MQCLEANMSTPENQLIIAISREFGSGGKEIALMLGKTYGIPVYEKNILSQLGISRQEDMDALKALDETPRWLIASRTVRGLTNSNEEMLAAMQFQFLRDEAEAGHSFIVLGHCAEEILRDNPALVTIFISADRKFKIPRIMEEHHLSEPEAVKMMKKHNKNRKAYHNYYCNNPWGDSRYYDLCLRSDVLGTKYCAVLIQDYIHLQRAKNNMNV